MRPERNVYISCTIASGKKRKTFKMRNQISAADTEVIKI